MFEDKVICEGVQRAICENPFSGLTSAEDRHVTACDACTELLLTRLLNQKPEVAIPAEFATRVRSQLSGAPETSRTLRTIPGYGFTTAVAALMVLALAWSVITYVDPGWWEIKSWFSLIVECIATLEIGGIALWLGTQRFTR